MRALSIRQPYAELILRWIKTAELRSMSTTIVGERFYIYACKAKAKQPVPIWSDDLRVAPPGSPPAWMIELAGAILPTGVIVGSAVIDYVTEIGSQGSEIRSQKSGGGNLTSDLCPLTASSPTSFSAPSLFAWHLADVRRARKFRKPRGHPQPVWFEPF